ncbi:MAG: heterodisulfide reductase-related iron-sulfur binding cluster, partial [candidate division NC10 bacterium]|nr:heterodisulfide reductase-related iron-sulfur binding cluster [candidate division NC10 bacterium]
MVQKSRRDPSAAAESSSPTRSGYLLFWGCQIPARLPFLEKGIRALLRELAISTYDLPDFTCCPERSFIANLDPSLWLLTAARNLALVEAEGLDLLTPCSGCYATFREAIHTMRVDRQAREKIQASLRGMGLHWNDRIQVLHLASLIHDTLGLDRIQGSLKHKLGGLRIAVHYGCNLLRSQQPHPFDHPSRPRKLDSLVEALGGISVQYETKGECCGESLGRTAGIGEARVMARRKLAAIRASEGDGILVACPACFMQFDTQQALMMREGENYQIPILFLSELIGLCLGLSPEELGLASHRTPVAPLLEKWESKEGKVLPPQALFDREALKRCLTCSACLNDCPIALTQEEYRPNLLIEKLLEGDLDSCLEDDKLWLCLECHHCSQLCPQNY